MQRVKMLSWDRISLVVPEKQDIKGWYEWLNNIETQGFLWPIFGNIISLENEEKYYEDLNKNDKQLTFSIFVEETQKVIWNISLMDIDYKNSHCEMWIAIFDVESRWKWYGRESIQLIKKYVFEILGLNKLYLRYISHNTHAAKTYEKCWFVETGRMYQHNYRFWKYYDDVLMEILKKDYQK